MKTYYKVVRAKSHKKGANRLVSAVMGHGRYGDDLERVYRPNRWTVGVKATPVMAFDSQKAAQVFARGSVARLEVWEADVRKPRHLSRILGLSRLPGFLRFWQTLQDKKQWWRLPTQVNDVWVGIAPPGTVACEAIRLVKKL